MKPGQRKRWAEARARWGTPELAAMLEDGWEPFAVQGDYTYLRRSGATA